MSDGIDPDGLAQRIANALRSTMGGGGDDGGEGGRVPYERFNRKVQEVNTLRAELESIGKAFGEYKEQQDARFSTLREEAAQQVAAIKLEHDQDLELVENGLNDPYGRLILRKEWDRAPKADRGKSPADFWKATVEAHKAHHADPENVQAPSIARPLTPYLPAIEAPKETPAPRQQSRQRLPPAPGKRTEPNLDSAPTDSPEDFIAFLRKHEG